MKKEVMKKWVKALRSGKYKRGSCYLRKKTPTGIRHCCLGVLCDITPGVTWDSLHDGICRASTLKDYSTTGLPYDVRYYAGISNSYGYIPKRRGLNSLSDINDSGKYNFNQIADIVEKHWEYL